MKDRFDHARGWFLKAESDLITVKRMLEGGGPYPKETHPRVKQQEP